MPTAYRGRYLPPAIVLLGLTLCAVVSAMLVSLASSRQKSELLLGAGVIVLCALLGSCGGGGNGGNGGGNGNGNGGGSGGTPAGTYTLHVIFTGGGGTTDLPITLIVQ